MSDILEREPWPFDWSPPARGYEGPSLAQLTLSLGRLGGRYADLARVVEASIFSVVALRDGLEKINGEEYDRAHR
jgi:hypothetical protein